MLPHVNFAEDSLFTFTLFKYNSKNINCCGSRIKSVPGNAFKKEIDQGSEGLADNASQFNLSANFSIKD